ncbi:hypothetical protein D9757_010663 [Collybiopsis confluens]|uniref:Uncharacterized protein n=1 Tax=Collybiopsis confluens TaxID=2823264 RepID=A0A8H5GMY1_9AGAR|nr:hypothetical protein D9757_010663 [Collybiopsis confluens]
MSSPPPPIPAGEILALKIITTDVLVEALFLGVQAVVTINGIYTLWSRGLTKSFGNKFLIGIITLLFCMSTCSLSLTIWDYMATFDELGGTFDATDISNKATIATMVFQRLAYFISDSIVVWRAWLLWDRNIFVRILLALCLLGTITATFVQGSLAVHQQVRQTGGVAQGSGARTLMFSLPLLFTNLVATILFGLKVWEHRRHIRSGSRGSVFNYMLLVLESSTLYCVCWILALIGALGGILSPIATAAIMGSLPYVTSIYPVAIVILVMLDKDNYGSFLQSSELTIPISNASPISSTINGARTGESEATFVKKRTESGDFSSSSEKF